MVWPILLEGNIARPQSASETSADETPTAVGSTTAIGTRDLQNETGTDQLPTLF